MFYRDGFEAGNDPKMFELLSSLDQAAYIALRQEFQKQRNELKTFQFSEILNRIKKFCIQKDDNDSARSYVCGICWVNNLIVINFHQFRLLVPLLRSTIQNMLQKLGYSSTKSSQKLIKSLAGEIPTLSTDQREQRSWHFFTYTALTPIVRIDDDDSVQTDMMSSPEPLEPRMNVEILEEKNSVPDKGNVDDIYSFFDDPSFFRRCFLLKMQ